MFLHKCLSEPVFVKDYDEEMFLYKCLSEPVFVKDYDEDSQGCVSSQDVLAHL